MTTSALSLPEVDSALDTMSVDADRIADALGALETHPGRLFLDGAALSGRTATVWSTAKNKIAELYEDFDRYRDVLAKAREVRSRRNRPGLPELTELTTLLRGSVIQLSSKDIPLERRNLTGPSSVTERISVTELLATMDRLFTEVTEVVVAADEVWTACVKQLDPMDERMAAARDTAGALGLGEARHPLFSRLSRIGDDVAALRARAFADPLSLYDGPLGAGKGGRPNLSQAVELDRELTAVRTDLGKLASVRDDYRGRLATAAASIDAVGAEETQARTAYATVRAKITSPPVETIADSVPFLRQQLSTVTALADRHRWTEVVDQLDMLGSAVDDCLRNARAVRDTCEALLGRRTELRGRLDAYRAKVGRLRYGEDAELAASYEQARDLLWTAPTDLRAATKALVRYQQLISDRETRR
jgi:hypothetical protein